MKNGNVFYMMTGDADCAACCLWGMVEVSVGGGTFSVICLTLNWFPDWFFFPHSKVKQQTVNSRSTL